MHRLRNAFTLTEMMVALAIFGVVSIGLFSFTAASLRLVGRNLATNHTHASMRISDQELLHDLHASASAFTLLTYNGTAYADVTPTSTTDVDAFTQDNISARSNGVRFRLLAGGPYQLTANTTTASTSLTFNFGVGSAVPYVPEVGDKVVLPLLSSAFDITAVTKTPAVGSTTGTVTISTLSASRSIRLPRGTSRPGISIGRSLIRFITISSATIPTIPGPIRALTPSSGTT